MKVVYNQHQNSPGLLHDKECYGFIISPIDNLESSSLETIKEIIHLDSRRNSTSLFNLPNVCLRYNRVSTSCQAII